MYEIKDFLKPYYKELEPKKRFEILNTLNTPHDSDDFADLEFLRSLYQDRYSDHENKGRKNIDWWLWRCLCLQVLYNKGNFFRKYRDREVMVILNELHMNNTEESHKKFFYHEYRNLAGRYLSTCRDSEYASRFLGFKKATDKEKIFRACKDIWQMSEGIAKSVKAENLMSLWCKAFYDELMCFDPSCFEEYKHLSVICDTPEPDFSQ